MPPYPATCRDGERIGQVREGSGKSWITGFPIQVENDQIAGDCSAD